MPLRPLRSGSISSPAFAPQLRLVAHNGQLTRDLPRGGTDAAALAAQRRRSRKVAVLCFGIGMLILVAAAAELLV